MTGQGSKILAIGFVLADLLTSAGALAGGMRCFDNLPVTDEVRQGQGEALIAAGYIDVTRAPYRADQTGTGDAAPAIQRAITDGYEQNLVVYLPKGTYLIGTPLVARQIENFAGCGLSNRKHGNIIIGDATGGGYPILKAKAGAFVGTTLLTMRFEGSLGAARHYVSLVRGLTIDMGSNPLGQGLSLEGAQLCSIEDILIRGSFDVGITGLPGSGGSLTNVTVIGGNVGIRQGGYRPTPSLQGVELRAQRKYGIELADARGGLIVVGFKIEGSGLAGVRITGADSTSLPRRGLVMADGRFKLAAPAISGSGNVIYLRNVYAMAPTIVSNAGKGALAGKALAWTRVGEFAVTSGPPLLVDGRPLAIRHAEDIATVSSAPTGLAGLHAWKPALVPSWFNTTTLDIRAYGATPDRHEDDDAPAINRALQDSAVRGQPVFVPRGRFNVRRTIEVPAGAAMIGSSYTNSIIYADEDWRPASPTALLRTEDAVGDVFLMDFAVSGHEPAPQNGQSANLMHLFHGRTSNILLRDVQITRREWWRDQEFGQTVALFSGHAGGRLYHLAFDFHENETASLPHHMLRIDGTSHPLAINQPDVEGTGNDPQALITNAANVTWYGLKYENTAGDRELLHVVDSRNIAILGGSGNYAGAQPFITVDRSRDVTIAVLARQGTVTGDLVREDGMTRLGPGNRIALYKKGGARPFGELHPPGFPYPQPR
jgi:hypothetical protein